MEITKETGKPLTFEDAFLLYETMICRGIVTWIYSYSFEAKNKKRGLEATIPGHYCNTPVKVEQSAMLADPDKRSGIITIHSNGPEDIASLEIHKMDLTRKVGETVITGISYHDRQITYEAWSKHGLHHLIHGSEKIIYR